MDESPTQRVYNQNYQYFQKLYSQLLTNNLSYSNYFQEILIILNNYKKHYTINSNTIGALINKLCEILVCSQVNKLDQQSKILKIKEVCNKIQKSHQNYSSKGQSIKKIKQYEKQICSKLMHQILHFSSGRHIPRITILFVIFMNAGWLRKQVINFALLALILGFQNISTNEDIKFIQHLLKIIYGKLKYNNQNNPFVLITYLLYLSKLPNQDRLADFQQIISCPYKVSSILLKFRHEYSNGESQADILECERKFSSLSNLIVDNLVLRALVSIFLDYEQQQIHSKIYFILMKLTRYDLSILIVKNLIKKLEIGAKMNKILLHWSNIFSLFRYVVDYPKFNHQSILLTKKEAYLQQILSYQINRIDFSFRSYRLESELLLCKLYCHPHVNQGKFNALIQIWITMRYLKQQNFLVSVLIIQDKSVINIQKAEIKLNQFEDNLTVIEIQGNTIKIMCEGLTQLIFTQNIINLSLSKFVIGDDTNEIGSFPCEISQLIFRQSNKRYDLVEKYRQHPQKLSENGNFLKIIIKKSLVYLLKIMGDLQLIMLIVSHVLRKMEDDESLVIILKKIMGFLGTLAEIKQVVGVQLKPEDYQKRISNVSCLSWIACKHKRKGAVIIELLSFLAIRKNNREVDDLEVLCNLVLFKDMKYKEFSVIVQKIANSLQSLRQKDQKQAMKFCQKMLLDLVMFFKNTQFLAENLQEDALKKHCIILKTVYFNVANASEQTTVSFLFFILKILFFLIDKRRQSDYIDITMAFQIGNFGLKLSKLIYQNHGQKDWFKTSQNKINDAISEKKLQIVAWIKQVLYFLDNQILYEGENKIKYYNWLQENLSFKLIKINEAQLTQICQQIQVYLISSDRNHIRRMSPDCLSQGQINYFWQINLLSVNIKDPIYEAKLKFLFQFGPYNHKTQIRNTEIMKEILKKSFQLAERYPPIKLPRPFIQILYTNNIDKCLKFILEVYTQKISDKGITDKIKNILGQNLLYLIYSLPDALYSNSEKIRLAICENPKIKNTLDLTERHLLIKELSSWASRMLNNNDSTFLSKSEVISKNSSALSSSSSINYSVQFEQVDKSFKSSQQSTIQIKEQIIKQSLEHIILLANPLQIGKFYKIEGDSAQKMEQIKCLTDNFIININKIIQIFQSKDQHIEERISKFKNQIFFLKMHAFQFSRMIMDEYVFDQEKTAQIKKIRKKSIAVLNSDKMRSQAEIMLNDYFSERRKSIFKIEKLWSQVEKNNKYFWELFFAHQSKHQSLDTSCNSLKMKSLIKIDNQKRQIQLPKAIVNTSITMSVSASSDKDLTNQGQSQGSIFEENIMYETRVSQESRSSKVQESVLLKKQKKQNQFSVVWITTTKIYQGVLLAGKYSIKFFEQLPDESFYDLICATPSERRTQVQIEKESSSFEIKFNKKSSMIAKRYLNHQAAVEIYSDMKSYLICFRKSTHRHKFIKLYDYLKGEIIGTEAKINQTAKAYAKKWQNGDISNFTYLMHLNDLGSRSFNDLSQYYVFPWVVTNFDATKIDDQFLNNPLNFRDLSKPVGALNGQRLKIILQKYEQSLKYKQTQSFLYGSFYSNPAFVCNYLVRLEPFAFHHYILQKNTFDLADRLFYSIENQFQGCNKNIGDYKQLIPEFYYLPQFLRNRSKYDFGYRQNKQLVHNVELPKWAKIQGPQWSFGEAPSQDKFIFQMRKILQSTLVTQNIHKWIDLIFGVYNRQDRGKQKDNLFVETIYKNQLKQGEDKQLSLLFYKQFGQVPRQLFQSEHEPSIYKKQLIKTSKCKPAKINLKLSLQEAKIPQIIFHQGQISWISASNYFHIATALTVDKYEQVLKTPFSQENCNDIRNLRLVKCLNSEERQTSFYLYLKSGQIICRELYYNLRRKLQIRQQFQITIPSVAFCNLAEVYEDFNIMVIAENQIIKIFNFHIQTRSDGLLGAKKKNNFSLHKKNQFTQHRSQIIFIKFCYSNSLLISLDRNHKVYVLQLCRDQIKVMQSFRLKKLGLCQSVTNMKIHQMGYIIISTQHLIHVYNFLGDYISRLDLEKLAQCSAKNKQTEVLTTFQIWNHQSAQLAIGTNFGHIYCVDFFSVQNYELLPMSSRPLKFIHINRIGKHWECIVCDRQNVFRLESQKYQEAYKRNY